MSDSNKVGGFYKKAAHAVRLQIIYPILAMVGCPLSVLKPLAVAYMSKDSVGDKTSYFLV